MRSVPRAYMIFPPNMEGAFQNHNFYHTFRPRLAKQNGRCVSKPQFLPHFQTQIGQKKWRLRFKTNVFSTLLHPDCLKKEGVFQNNSFYHTFKPRLGKKMEGAFQNHNFYYTFRPRLLKKVEGAFQNHSFYYTFKSRLVKTNGGCVSKPQFSPHF